jgi:hypothetical protein
MNSRREFLENVSLVGLVASTQLSAPLGLFANKPLESPENIRLDPTIMASLQEDLMKTHERMKSRGRAQSADIAIAATTMKLAFRHFEDVGLNAQVEKYLTENEGEFLNGPSPQKRSHMMTALRDTGLNMPDEYLEHLFSISREKKENALKMIQDHGIKNLIEGSLPSLDEFSEKAWIDRRPAGQRFLTSFKLKRVAEDPNCKAIAILELILETFIVATGSLAIFLPPLWVAVAVAGAIDLILRFIDWVFC